MGKHARRTKERLEARRKSFDKMKSEGPGARPGSIKVRTSPYQVMDFHRPGSHKK